MSRHFPNETQAATNVGDGHTHLVIPAGKRNLLASVSQKTHIVLIYNDYYRFWVAKISPIL